MGCGQTGGIVVNADVSRRGHPSSPMVSPLDREDLDDLLDSLTRENASLSGRSFCSPADSLLQAKGDWPCLHSAAKQRTPGHAVTPRFQNIRSSATPQVLMGLPSQNRLREADPIRRRRIRGDGSDTEEIGDGSDTEEMSLSLSSHRSAASTLRPSVNQDSLNFSSAASTRSFTSRDTRDTHEPRECTTKGRRDHSRADGQREPAMLNIIPQYYPSEVDMIIDDAETTTSGKVSLRFSVTASASDLVSSPQR
eukprot:Hpha_TRINITY_DN14731_c0_g1::TRINITY_DN14731_c0_g1_i1::g.102873::m.102873